MTANTLTERKTDSFEHSYPMGYRTKSIEEQVDILCSLFLGLHKEYPSKKLIVPDEAEGWFCIPNLKKTKRFDSYGNAVVTMLGYLNHSRGEKYISSLNCSPKHLRESNAKMLAMNVIRKQQQDANILLIPAQFGMKYRNLNAPNALHEMHCNNEFPLGAYEVAIMLLTHPERLQSANDLRIDCPGDEYSLSGVETNFNYHPFFHCDLCNGKNYLGPIGNSIESHMHGSASGFFTKNIEDILDGKS